MTGESQVEEPRTEAGRALFADPNDVGGVDVGRDGSIHNLSLLRAIRAIERDARNLALTAVEEGVARLPTWDKRTVPGGMHVNRRAVLAAITALRQPQEAKDTRGEPR